MKTKIVGYMVIEKCEDFKQPLGLVKGAAFPEGGILTWMEGARAVFPSRQAARNAITRTEHYRLAFGYQYPERKFCQIVPLVAV